MSLESAMQQDTGALVGDLQSVPKPERRLFNQDIYALEWIIPHAGIDAPFFRGLIRDRQELLRSELANADLILDAVLVGSLGPQFRSRPDYEHRKTAVEQWIPALDCWMVNGYFLINTPAREILATLQAGDPRKRTADEELADRREKAAAKRESNDRASTDRILGAVDRMTNSQVENFVAVEGALHTGENITLRGDDRRRIEKLEEQTRKAAHQGDKEAQNVILHGQQDNRTCLLPTTNPLRHRHRKELEEAQRAK